MPELGPVPADALAGMDGWAARLAWSLVPERVTWHLRGPNGESRYLKVSRHREELSGGPSLLAERDRLEWAAARLPVPRVLRYGFDDG